MNWSDFLENIKKVRESLRFEENEECFYRGHSSNTWKLLPGLFREPNSSIEVDGEQLISEELWSIEADLYYEFHARAKEIHDANLKDWDVLFYMQHHRVRTRLLDWTESFATALYFAINDPKMDHPCIWILNPYEMNQKLGHDRDLWAAENLDCYIEGVNETYSELLLGIHTEEDGEMFYWSDPIALYPIRRNNRLASQAGYFTIHGNNVVPLEDLNNSNRYLKRVDIPAEVINDAREFLKLAGVNDFTMFPDLDGLAKFLNKKYFK